MKISDIVNVLKNNDLVICYDDCLVNIDYVSYNSKDIKYADDIFEFIINK